MTAWNRLRRISTYEGNADCVIVVRLVLRDDKWVAASWESANWLDEPELPEGAAAAAAGVLARYSLLARAGTLVSDAARAAFEAIRR